MPAPVSITDLAEIHKISDSLLSRWKREGTDVYDSRAVVSRIWNSRRKAPEWEATVDALTKGANAAGSHEEIRRLKTQAELRRLDLINGRLAGDSFAKDDCQQVMASLGSALTLGLTEMSATLPSLLEGLDASGVSVPLDAAIYKLREQLGDLESELWQKVYEGTPEMEAASNPDNKTTRISTRNTTAKS